MTPFCFHGTILIFRYMWKNTVPWCSSHGGSNSLKTFFLVLDPHINSRKRFAQKNVWKILCSWIYNKRIVPIEIVLRRSPPRPPRPVQATRDLPPSSVGRCASPHDSPPRAAANVLHSLFFGFLVGALKQQTIIQITMNRWYVSHQTWGGLILFEPHEWVLTVKHGSIKKKWDNHGQPYLNGFAGIILCMAKNFWGCNLIQMDLFVWLYAF